MRFVRSHMTLARPNPAPTPALARESCAALRVSNLHAAKGRLRALVHMCARAYTCVHAYGVHACVHVCARVPSASEQCACAGAYERGPWTWAVGVGVPKGIASPHACTTELRVVVSVKASEHSLSFRGQGFDTMKMCVCVCACVHRCALVYARMPACKIRSVRNGSHAPSDTPTA